MNKGSIVERLCSDLDRKEPRYKSPTLLYFWLRSSRWLGFPGKGVGGATDNYNCDILGAQGMLGRRRKICIRALLT